MGDDPRTAGAQALRWRAALGGAPRAVWAIVAVHVALLAAWSVTAPVYRAPDEPHHVDMVLHSRTTLSWPDPLDRQLSRRVTRSMEASGFAETADPVFRRNVEPVLAVDAPPRAARPSFAELAPDVPSTQRNQMPQHPPLYYWLLAGALEVVPGVDGWAHDRVVGLLRLCSAALVAPLPLLAWAAARQLLGASPAARRAGLAAAAATVAVPQLSHVGGSVNNDNLLVVSVGAATVVAAAVMRGDDSARTAVWFGALSAVALLAKGFALFLPALWLAAYGLAAVRTRRWRRAAAGLGVTLAAAAPGVAWWVRNLIRHGTLQPRGTLGRAAPEDYAASAGEFLAHAGPQLAQRFWGSFGWVEVSLSWRTVYAATAVLAVLVVAGVALRPAGDGWRRADLAGLLVPLLGLLGVVLYGAWGTYTGEGRFGGLAGRYLFPAAVGLAVVAGLGAGRLLRSWAPAALLLAAGVLQALGLRAALLRWYGHPDHVDYVISGAALLAWSPWPRLPVLGLAGLAAAAAVWAAAETVLAGVRQRGGGRGVD